MTISVAVMALNRLFRYANEFVDQPWDVLSWPGRTLTCNLVELGMYPLGESCVQFSGLFGQPFVQVNGAVLDRHVLVGAIAFLVKGFMPWHVKFKLIKLFAIQQP